jgi:hypothetical protein
MPCSIEGKVEAEDLGHGLWRLQVPGGDREIRVRADGLAAADFGGCTQVSVQWRGEAVFLTVVTPAAERVHRLHSALVHEPLPRLYDGLPLAHIDAGTRRFWRWVFRVVRLPGGSRLLELLVRRAR